MGARIRLQVGGEQCLIELLEESAPSLSATLKRVLPHSSIAVHCQTAGDEFYCPLPFFHWHENRKVPTAGDVGYASMNNYLCIYYGQMDPKDGPTNLIGRMVDGFDAVKRVVPVLMERGVLPARITVLGEEERPEGLPPLPEPRTTFTGRARAFLERTVTGVPADIKRLRAVPRLAMGNIAGRFQAAGALLSISDNLLVCRMQAFEGKISLPSVNWMTAVLVRRSLRWLEATPLEETVAALRELAAWLEQEGPKTAEEFAASVDEVLVALGRLRIWADAITPWSRLSTDYLPDSKWLPDLAEFR